MPSPADAERARLRELTARMRSGDVCERELREIFAGFIEVTIGAAEADVVTEVAALQLELRAKVLAMQAGRLTRINEGLTRLAAIRSTAELVRRAPELLCASCGFDRALISRIQGSVWIPESLHMVSGADDEVNRDSVIPARVRLTGMLAEAEVVRRRKSVIVDRGREHGSVTGLPGWRGYVVAPVVVGHRAVGLLHADHHGSGREPSEADLAGIGTFAELLGPLYESVSAGERLREQQRALAGALTGVVRGDPGEEALTLTRAGTSTGGGAHSVTRPAAHPGGLTEREWDILRLLATGATNTQIAATLVVSESTVKSHVKRVLRKLRAANRAEAVLRYTQLAGQTGRTR